ncbi:hypothetical protein ALC57_13629 [Trachymyrmex cornetzi]|uniref:Uncharacterized protein n=1 Tax=Trachymyrmex cornetzi TaxID=471704 RepID=A0A195DMB7_9HYME|nr:hypothetical protein ALC57_13629 [Trachymyrmex cornetzi]
MTVLAIGHGCGCAICATVSSRLPVFRVVTPDRLLTSDNDFENRAPSLCEQRRVGIHNARTQRITAAATACGVKNTCAAKHAAILRSVGRPKEASISPLIDRSAGASDKILSSFWSCPTHRRPSDGPHASCEGQGEGDSPLPAARGPPTSWAQRRYLAEGKSLLDHPHRLLVAGAWATLFQGAHREFCGRSAPALRTSPPLRLGEAKDSAKSDLGSTGIHHADRGVGPTWVVPVLRKQSFKPHRNLNLRIYAIMCVWIYYLDETLGKNSGFIYLGTTARRGAAVCTVVCVARLGVGNVFAPGKMGTRAPPPIVSKSLALRPFSVPLGFDVTLARSSASIEGGSIRLGSSCPIDQSRTEADLGSARAIRGPFADGTRGPRLRTSLDVCAPESRSAEQERGGSRQLWPARQAGHERNVAARFA